MHTLVHTVLVAVVCAKLGKLLSNERRQGDLNQAKPGCTSGHELFVCGCEWGLKKVYVPWTTIITKKIESEEKHS